MSYSKWTTQKIKYGINKPTYLSISSDGSLILDGQRADAQKFRLYVISDTTYKSYADARYLKLDGSKPMTGRLKMGNKKITEIGDPTDDNDATNKKYVDDENAKQDTSISGISDVSTYNTNLITALQSSKADQQYVDDKIKESEERSTRSLYKENVFKKVMDDGLFIEDDDDIHKIGKVDKDFHRVNKQTYHFQIDYDSSDGYYSTRLAVNVVYLPIGFYILCFEMYFSDKIDHQNITVNCRSGTLEIISKNTEYLSDHSRSIFNFRKTVARPIR